MIIREVMSQLKVGAAHFLQAPEGESCTQCVWSLRGRQRLVRRYILLKMPMIRASSSTFGGLVKTQDKIRKLIKLGFFLFYPM